MQLPKWMEDALVRIDAETCVVLIHNEEDIKKYQEICDIGRPLKIGDTVIISTPQPFVADAQVNLDNFKASEWKRNNLDLYIAWKYKGK